MRTRDDQRDTAEEALVQGAGSGDTEAFGRLVHLYQRRAVSLAYRLLGDGQDAADVSQDAFVRAYENLGQLQDASRFGPWLMKIVSNLSLNFRRARATRATATLDEEAETPDKLRFPRGDRLATMPSDAAEDESAGRLHAAISAALEKLPEKQRLALILFSVEGWPQKQVAQILDCSVELVKWNVFQARKKLSELL